MHTLVPHEHHEELSYEENLIEHNSADSILDYLQLAFHVDMGEGHLEHLDHANSLDFDQVINTNLLVPICGLIAFLSPYHTEFSAEDFDVFVDHHRIPKDIHLQTPVLRGPPTLS